MKDNSKFNSRRNDRIFDSKEVEESLQTSFALYDSGNYIKYAQHSISSLRKKYSSDSEESNASVCIHNLCILCI